mmetsp:Transcript_24982/g.59455  ORF Transcript_24982/g.59455 Transcript_24982/m.59455 type:complete len:278 (-) Transcript_24982:1750-2583(-)
MGAYLSQPETEKNSASDENSFFSYGVSAMQGWRTEMEDAHMCRLWLADKEDVGLFGVFDGHGGQEVALFCAKYLADELQKTDAFRRKEYASALEQTFRQLDRMVADRSRWPELRELAAENQEGNPAAMDESELPEYLTRVLEAARQRHKSLVAGEEEEEEEEDDDEMDDEVGDPNFNPEFQDQVQEDPLPSPSSPLPSAPPPPSPHRPSKTHGSLGAVIAAPPAARFRRAVLPRPISRWSLSPSARETGERRVAVRRLRRRGRRHGRGRGLRGSERG